MSRNFDLMNQLETEFGSTHSRVPAATAPAIARTALPEDVAGPRRDAIARLVQGLFLSATENIPRQVVFCGVDSENGSSSVCASTGKALAAANLGSVCLIDANFRSRHLSRIFGIDKSMSFPRLSSPIREQCHVIGDGLWLCESHLFAGDRDVLASATKLRQVLAELRTAFEFVLIDAPGTGVSGDAAILGHIADGSVLVIEADITRRLAARNAKEALDAANVHVLGTVLHNRSFPIPEGLYKRL